ncbi:LuxR C-terminal-related transcriptional regulator [Streptomyces caeruleatus]
MIHLEFYSSTSRSAFLRCGPGSVGRTEWMGAMDKDQNGSEVCQPVDGLVLSSVQARILEGVAAGFSSGRLSRELYLSSKTIDYHVRVMSHKLQATNRVALVSRAFVLQVLRTDSWPPRISPETVD